MRSSVLIALVALIGVCSAVSTINVGRRETGDVEIFRQERLSVQTVIPLAHQITFTYSGTAPITQASFEIDETIDTINIVSFNEFDINIQVAAPVAEQIFANVTIFGHHTDG